MGVAVVAVVQPNSTKTTHQFQNPAKIEGAFYLSSQSAVFAANSSQPLLLAAVHPQYRSSYVALIPQQMDQSTNDRWFESL